MSRKTSKPLSSPIVLCENARAGVVRNFPGGLADDLDAADERAFEHFVADEVLPVGLRALLLRFARFQLFDAGYLQDGQLFQRIFSV